jgi:hypothetical protein
VFPFFPESGDAQILQASVGWDDEDEYVFLGEDSNDGYTLVRCQLFTGRDFTKPINPHRAQGTKVIAHISSLNGLRIPPKDSRVFLACEKGQEHVVGAAVIFAAVDALPARVGNIKADETAITGPEGSTGRVMVKKSGTVALVTNADNSEGSKMVALMVAPDGLRFSAPWGSFRFDATGLHVRTAGGPAIDMGQMNIPGLPDSIAGALTGYCNITAPSIKLNGNLVYLGAGTTYDNCLSAPGSAIVPGTTMVTTGPPFQSCSVRVAKT